MQRRRFLASIATGVCAGFMGGCLGAGEGTYARRIAVNGSIRSRKNTKKAWTDRGLALLDYEFYRHESSSGVRGTVTNRANVDIDFVAAYARFFDRTGTRIGHAYDAKSGLPAGEKWQFDAELHDTDPRKVARYRLVVIDQRSTEVEHPFQTPQS